MFITAIKYILMKNTVYFYQINKPKLYVFLYVNLHGETFKTLVYDDIWHLVDILNFEDSILEKH